MYFDQCHVITVRLSPIKYVYFKEHSFGSLYSAHFLWVCSLIIIQTLDKPTGWNVYFTKCRMFSWQVQKLYNIMTETSKIYREHHLRRSLLLHLNLEKMAVHFHFGPLEKNWAVLWEVLWSNTATKWSQMSRWAGKESITNLFYNKSLSIGFIRV